MDDELEREFVDGLSCKRDETSSRINTSMRLEDLQSDVIGAYHPFQTPFGTKPIVYADWIASGRALGSIERFIESTVLPFYANTHTSSSITGLQSTCFRHEARQIIQQAVNANSVKDVVVFTGSGATSAVNKLVSILGLKVQLEKDSPRPLVLVGPWEHHSNLLPWRESCADVIQIEEDANGVHLKQLEEVLKGSNRPIIIGSFSAASNVTGVQADVLAVTALLHRYGALACWDFAAAAPYCKIDMNPVLPGDHPDRAFVHIDAAFISPHKLLGGINTPGLLIAKKRLFANPVPENVGGGTVYFVDNLGHRYLSNREEREEAGTPDVVGAVRAGLCFQLKQRIGIEAIAAADLRLCASMKSGLENVKNLVLLGPQGTDSPRIPILSFLVRHGNRFLHYQFVASLLNDVFGIQSRGGCMCAGPFAQKLLGIPEDIVAAIDHELVHDSKHSEYLRPGFTRLSLAYFIDEKELNYILQAVAAIAQFGWRLLPLYKFNCRTGEWKHKTRFTKFPHRLWLGDIHQNRAPHIESPDFDVLLAAGQAILNGPVAHADFIGDQTLLFSESAAPLRWFVLPSEAVEELHQKISESHDKISESHQKTSNQKISESELHLVQKRLFDPTAYWESLNVNPKKPRQQKVVCEDNSCFRPRTTDKYPLRTQESIQAEEPHLVINDSKEMANATLRPKPPKSILKWVGKAMMEWDMIKDGDTLLLGLSGGKDSLCLLHVLLDIQKRAPIKFEIAACTIDPMTESFDPSPLIPYMESLGVPYHFIKTPIFDMAKSGSLQGNSICSFCARLKRGALYGCAKEHGYTTLVLAQHLDDLAETTMMGLFHNGHLRTMMANYVDKSHGIRVIRPLVYVREQEMKKFSYSAKLPVINENCPACFEAPQERKRVKKMLAREESTQPSIFSNMRRALTPLMSHDILETLKQEINLREENGKPEKYKMKK